MPINLTINISSTYLDTDNSNLYAIKSGNVISFSGRIVTARQTSTSDLVRICVIQNISLVHTIPIITDNNDVSSMYVNKNGEVYLAMSNLPVGTMIRFNACLISN